EIISNGVDLGRYRRSPDPATNRARLGFDRDRRYVASVARFHPVKDHPTLLRAFAVVASTRSDVDLLLVGDGTLRGGLERLARDLGITERVRFMGIRDDVADILSTVDVFALTSLSEAASITLLEAMASELPVVVTDVGGNPEIVRHGIDGLLAPRGDAAAVAAALLRLLDDPRSAASMGRAAAERVRTMFTIAPTTHRSYPLYPAHSFPRTPPSHPR